MYHCSRNAISADDLAKLLAQWTSLAELVETKLNPKDQIILWTLVILGGLKDGEPWNIQTLVELCVCADQPFAMKSIPSPKEADFSTTHCLVRLSSNLGKQISIGFDGFLQSGSDDVIHTEEAAQLIVDTLK